MLKRILKDKTLILLIIINFINAVSYAIGGSFINIKYITVVLTFFILIFCKQEKSLPIVFYLHCNSALYDDIGFTYIFNFSILIVLLKEIFLYRSKLNKNTTILLIVLFLYNLCLMMLNDIFSIYRILSMVSWLASYLLLIIYSYNKKTDFENIYRYFFVGFIMSCFCAFIIPLKIWGTNIPTAYRFIGLLRDPNYYSFDALFLIFSAKSYAQSIDKTPSIYMLIISLLGILSVSKMFILLLVIGFILYCMFNANKVKIKSHQIIFSIIMLCLVFVFAYNSNFINTLISKYSYRNTTTSLFTGRDKIHSYYINYIFDNPIVLLFGQSTSYSILSNIGSYIGDFYVHMVAHNTYLDFLLSWGILFSLVYLYYIYEVIKSSFKSSIKGVTNDSKVLTIIFLLGLFSLSYLQADVFPLLILYIILLSKNGNEVEK